MSIAMAVAIYGVLPCAKIPFRYNLRNLQARWKSTVVTALAFTLVIALFTVMLGFVRGLERLTANSGRPENVVILSDGATDEIFSSLPASLGVELLPGHLQELVVKNEHGRYQASKEVYVVVNHVLPGSREGSVQRRFVQLRGVSSPPEVPARVHDLQLQPGGRWFSESGVCAISSTEEAYEVVIGDDLAVSLAADNHDEPIRPGDLIDLADRKWYVVGVMDSGGSAFGSEVWARDTLVGQTYGRINSYSCNVWRARDAEAAKILAAEINRINVDGRSLQALTEREYYDRLRRTNRQFLVAVLVVAIFMAIGGALGVMNTMFAAISQRTRDIGMLRLLGYSRWHILVSFLSESLAIALLGGLAGCAIGSLADGWTASSVIHAGGGGGGRSVLLHLRVDSSTLAAGVLFALIIGAVGGLIPSLSATRLRPLESLL
jgi:cell division protein FtsX